MAINFMVITFSGGRDNYRSVIEACEKRGQIHYIQDQQDYESWLTKNWSLARMGLDGLLALRQFCQGVMRRDFIGALSWIALFPARRLLGMFSRQKPYTRTLWLEEILLEKHLCALEFISTQCQEEWLIVLEDDATITESTSQFFQALPNSPLNPNCDFLNLTLSFPLQELGVKIVEVNSETNFGRSESFATNTSCAYAIGPGGASELLHNLKRGFPAPADLALQVAGRKARMRSWHATALEPLSHGSRTTGTSFLR